MRISDWSSDVCASDLSAGEVRPKSAPIIGVPYVTEAPIVMLKDLDSGRILFSRGADQRFTPASMAKVMTAYVVIDLIEKGELSRDKLFTVEDATWKLWSARPGESDRKSVCRERVGQYV